MKISFRVYGKPPKKSSGPSIWSSKERSCQVLDLRRSAAEAKGKSSAEYPLKGLLKLKLIIHYKYITKTDSQHEYIGDLDSLAAGVCDALKKAGDNVKPHARFDQYKETDPKKPLIIEDDSNITVIEASKIKDTAEYYTVTVEEIRNSGVCGFLKGLRG